MKKFFYLFTLLGVMLACQCCSNDEPSGGGSGGKDTTLRLNKLDLSGAKALAIIDESDTRSSDEKTGLFKIDENGNITAVYVEVVELEDGTQQNVARNYTLHPGKLCTIGDRYIFMSQCLLRDAKGNIHDVARDYEGDSAPVSYFDGFSILVNKNTGKIYYVPTTISQCFPNGNGSEKDIVVAPDGTFYMHVGSGVVKVVVDGDNATLSTFGPQNGDVSSFCGGGYIPLSNGAVIAIHSDTGGTNVANQIISILYQNGGFETFDGSNDEWHRGFGDIKDEYTCCYDNGKIFAIHRPADNFKSHWDYKEDGYAYEKRYDTEDVELSLVEINIGSSYNNVRIGQPFFTLKGKNYIWDDYTRPEASDWTEYARQMGGEQSLYILGDYFMIGNVLAINRNTYQYRDLVKEGISEHVIRPDANNVYKGKAWTVYLNAAMWFNPADMTYGQVTWNVPEHVDQSEYDIPNGKLIIVWLNPADGSKHMRTIDIETGAYTDTDVQTTQKVFQLIPLN